VTPAPAPRHFVVMLSGGLGSWMAGRRTVDKVGAENVTLVFTDVKGADDSPYTGEDQDTYRFLAEGAADLGAPLVRLRDGRDIWDVFLEKGHLGNSQLSHCSWELKTIPVRKWLEANYDPATTTVVVGMDWAEGHRHAAVHFNYAHSLAGCVHPLNRKRKAEKRPSVCSSLFDGDGQLPGPGCKNLLSTPWTVWMPLTERPLLGKLQIAQEARLRGLEPPRLYRMGFPHANCITCVKGGQTHWERVYRVFPDHFAYAERREQVFRASKPSRADAAVLRHRSGPRDGKGMSLREYRELLQAGDVGGLDLEFDFGGCGCMTEGRPEALSAE
jgi:hypothetical protein